MSNWKIGDEAVCIGDGDWVEDSGRVFSGPKYMERNIVTEVYVHRSGDVGLGFAAYGEDVFDQSEFRKLSEVCSELSSEILEKITEEIKEPELCPQ